MLVAYKLFYISTVSNAPRVSRWCPIRENFGDAHNANEACAIVKNLIALVEGQHVDLVAACSSQSGAPSQGDCPISTGHRFYGEILPRWIPGTKESPMHAYTWYVWRKRPRSGPSLKVRIGKPELAAFLAALDLPNALPVPRRAA
jgi:hypothetical protein